VRSVVVVGPPVFDEPTGLRQTWEPMLVEALVARPTVQRFNKAILHRLARCNLVPFDPTFLLPSNDGVRGQLGAVVADDHAGLTAELRASVPARRRFRTARYRPQESDIPA